MPFLTLSGFSAARRKLLRPTKGSTVRIRNAARLRFIPVGKPQRIALGELGNIVCPDGSKRPQAGCPAPQSARIFVGLTRGRESPNKTDRCRYVPRKFAAKAIDRTLLRLRENQVGKKNVGATRIFGKGWYEGAPEKTAVYEILYIPNDREPTFRDFQRNISFAAEEIGERWCQDDVYVSYDSGKQKETVTAKWYK